jgi:acylphosphatase
VQRVGFRIYARSVAKGLELSGWVRNNRSKTVECEAQGEEQLLGEFCNKLRKGPVLSYVKEIVVAEIPLIEEGDSGFKIIRNIVFFGSPGFARFAMLYNRK